MNRALRTMFLHFAKKHDLTEMLRPIDLFIIFPEAGPFIKCIYFRENRIKKLRHGNLAPSASFRSENCAVLILRCRAWLKQVIQMITLILNVSPPSVMQCWGVCGLHRSNIVWMSVFRYEPF